MTENPPSSEMLKGTLDLLILRVIADRALAEQDPPVVLVLDDLHLITTPGPVQELATVLRYAQPGLHLIAVCGRRQAGVNIPPTDEIEARLKEQEISLISKRQLRDLRNSATIEFP